jgi:hypothetical protein
MDTKLTRLKSANMPRWFSVCLILAVFFLPLHLHVTSPLASQVTKECICLHGSRTQANLAAASAVCAPVIVVCAVALFTQVEFPSESIRIPSSRAPPAALSV